MKSIKLSDIKDFLIIGLLLTMLVVWPPHSAKATYNSIATLKTPSIALTLPANVVTAIPAAMNPYCAIIIRHHAADPVFYGGPKIGGVAVSNVTVNATGGAGTAVCTDTALCDSDVVTVNVMTGGIAFLSVGGTTLTYTVGEGCQP